MNKRGEAASSNTHPAKDESACKRSKLYLHQLNRASKYYMIHGLGHSSDEFNILGEFRTKYAADQPTKNRGSNPIPKKGYQEKQDNRAIIDNMVDELHVVESKNLSAINHEAPEFLESDYNSNDLYQVENMSLGETKEKYNGVSVRLVIKIHI